MLSAWSSLRRASRTTSSENIWLYVVGFSTGLVRWSFDFSSLTCRITVSSRSLAALAWT